MSDQEAPPAQPTPEDIPQEVIRLHEAGYGTRRIRDRLHLSRDRVRKILEQAGRLDRAPRTSKLAPYAQAIAERVEKRLTASRILREIRALGYQGGRTILSQKVHTLRAQLALAPKPKVKRRFETRPGQEMQIDWSPYTVPIAGRATRVHALGCLLCFSRKLFVACFRDERQAFLLEGLARAFESFDGCAARLVLDNMSTAVLGRWREREVLWHPRFHEFAKHYGTEPFACQIADPDRKGKKEKSFRLLWDDCLKGVEFPSWEELEAHVQRWLDHTPEAGNLRVHGTTGRVPNEVYAEEHPLLIRLPGERFPVHTDDTRCVDSDSTLSVDGRRYTVPSALANTTVAVRLYAHHFDVLDPFGRVAFSRRYAGPEVKEKLVIDPTHYATLPRRPRGTDSGDRLDQAFCRRFPELEPLVAGLKLRFKALTPIQLRALLRTADRFGEEAFRAAARRAQDARRFDAKAIERMLERDHPLAEEPLRPLHGAGPAVLGEVEPASLDSFADLDHAPPATPPRDPDEDDPHGS
jgi:transposase